MENLSIKKPVIGISSSLLTIDQGWFVGKERLFVGYDYIEGIVRAGGVPFVLPVIGDKELISEQIRLVDGLLLSGGYDVSPQFYGEEPHPRLEATHQFRDLHEIELARFAYQAGKPILGVCRGLQLLNVVFGGTLYQDIESSIPDTLQHIQKAKPHEATHQVQVTKDTLLYRLLEQELVATNSYHHQAIKTVAPTFSVNARSKDGIIEGIEKTDRPFVLGVQWHPELMVSHSSLMLKLFEGFVQAARNIGERA